MGVLVSLEHRFTKHNGSFYDRTVYGRSFWQPYVDAFGEVSVIARAREVVDIGPEYTLVNADGVRFIEIPDYSASIRSLRLLPSVARIAREAALMADAIVLRVPCNVGHILWYYGRQRGVPIAVEVIADLWDSSALMAWPVRTLRRYGVHRLVQAECRTATVASYVTKEFLQHRYPPGQCTESFAWSDNLLTGADVVPNVRVYDGLRPINLVYTANFVKYKGHRILLDALRIVSDAGLEWRLTLIGDGACRKEVEIRAEQLGLSKWIRFAGSVSNHAVLRILDESHLYVTPSLHEGLPRSVIEAQARGLPVVGFSVGGLPELVHESLLVAPPRADSLAKLILSVTSSASALAEGAEQSLTVAVQYIQETQSVIRMRSYSRLIEASSHMSA